MEFIFFLMLLIIFLCHLFILFVYKLYKNKSNTDVVDLDYSNTMNHTQKKLFDKQVLKFKNVFRGFSNYQLLVIKNLIDDILCERR